MPELKELVKKELKDTGSDEDTLSLCNDIFDWNEKGGPDNVENEIIKRMKEIKSVANKQLKETKKIMPKQKKKKKTRR